jgi:hypothetical protein
VKTSSLIKTTLTAGLFFVMMNTTSAKSTTGDTVNELAEEEVVESDSSLLHTAVDGISEYSSEGSAHGEESEENVSTLSFNILHYVLCKFKMNDIL